jgi:hypothetical protein
VSTADALDTIARDAARGCDMVWSTRDPEFSGHLAACLSEGLCPRGHPLEVPADAPRGRICRHCEPVSYWIAEPPGGWLWARWHQ